MICPMLRCLLILCLMSSTALAGDAQHTLTPLLSQFCYECHGDGSASGDFSMDTYKSTDDFVRAARQWQKAIALGRAHIMPPPDAEHQPSQDQRDQLVAANPPG